MKVDNCYQLGEVVKTHGLKGEVILHLDVDDPQAYTNLESVFLEQSGKLVPFFISSCQIQGETARLKFEDIDGVDAAKEIVGDTAYLPLDFLPDLGDDSYYFHELIDYTVVLEGKTVGHVTDIYPQDKNPMFGYDHQGHEVLVPIQDQFVTSVNKKTKEIYINLPEGYLEIYTET